MGAAQATQTTGSAGIGARLKHSIGRVAMRGASELARAQADPAAYARRELGQRDKSANPMLRAGQAGGDVVNVILVIVIAAVVGYVGIKAASETNDSIDVAAGSQFENSSNSITDGFASAMDLTEVVFIVLMLSVIIAVLVGLRGRR